MLDGRRPAGRLAAAATRPTRWPWPSATTPAAGCTGPWSTPASRTRPTAATTSTTATARCTASLTCEPEQAAENLRHRARDPGRGAAGRHHRRGAGAGQEQDRLAGGPRQRAADGPDAGHRRRLGVQRRVPRRGHRTGPLRRRDAWPTCATTSTATPSTGRRRSPSARSRTSKGSRGRWFDSTCQSLAATRSLRSGARRLQGAVVLRGGAPPRSAPKAPRRG